MTGLYNLPIMGIKKFKINIKARLWYTDCSALRKAMFEPEMV